MNLHREKRHRELPALNMSSLPDLIFTVLFFFMIVTTMRSVPTRVTYKTPYGTQLSPLKKNPTTIYVMIGHPLSTTHKTHDDKYVIQINERIGSVDQMKDIISSLRGQLLPDEQEELTVVLKIDEHVPMGVVTDVKMALREAGALKIHYSASHSLEKTEKEPYIPMLK